MNVCYQWKLKGVTVDPLPRTAVRWVKWSIGSYRAALVDIFEFNCRYSNKTNGTNAHNLDGGSQSLAIGHFEAFPLGSSVHLFAEFASKKD